MFNFFKFHANGNDFLFLLKKINKLTLNKILNSKSGICCDQLFVIKNINYKKEYIKIEIFNRDMSKALNCGNGIRTLSNFFLKKKNKNKIIKIIINNNYIFSYKNNQNIINTIYNKPNNIKNIIIKIKKFILKIGFVDLYNYHVIIIVKNIKSYNINLINKFLKSFFNYIVNIEFVQIINKSCLYIRIIEKGVGETYSCGSGIISSAYYINNIFFLNKKLLINTLGGNCFINIIKNYILISGKVILSSFGFL